MEILRHCILGAEVLLSCFRKVELNFLQLLYHIVFLCGLKTFLSIFAVACETMLGPKVVVETLNAMCAYLAG